MVLAVMKSVSECSRVELTCIINCTNNINSLTVNTLVSYKKYNTTSLLLS